MARRYRVGAIGRTGRGDYGHGIDVAWLGVPGVEFVAVADDNADGLREAAERTGARVRYCDYREMLAKEDLDFVSVCPRWADGHRDMVLACAEAGAHIYSEKPLARTLAEADEMLAACERAGVSVAVAHQMRAFPHVRKAKELVEAGAIGRLQYMRGYGKQDERGGGEDLIVLGSHILDLMRLFAGEVEWAFGHIACEGREIGPVEVREGPEGLGLIAGDEVTGYYSFASGVRGLFESRRDRGAGRPSMSLELYGSSGIIAIRQGDPRGAYLLRQPILAPPDAGLWEELSTPEPAAANDFLEWANREIVQGLIATTNGELLWIPTGYDARAGLEMILALYESQRTGARVHFPLSQREHPLAVLAEKY